MSDLAEWLSAQLDADEGAARAAFFENGEWRAERVEDRLEWWVAGEFGGLAGTGYVGNSDSQPIAEHIALHDPAFELARIAALRAVVEDAVDCMAPDRAESDPSCDGFALFALQQLAQPFRGRPGWRDEWTVAE